MQAAKNPKLSPLADGLDDRDVGEEVMMLSLRHGRLQFLAVLEVTHQDAQAVLVGELRGDDLKHGLGSTHKGTAVGRGSQTRGRASNCSS